MTEAPTTATTSESALSVSAYAQHRGVSHTAVQRAIADGRLSRSLVLAPGRPPQLLPSLADLEWEAHTSPAHARATESPTQVTAASAPRIFPPPSAERRSPTADDYRRSLVLEKVVKTKLAQVRLDEQQGRLIDAAEAGHAQFEIARLVRNQLHELPDRLADELALESDAHRVRSILARELDDVLRKLARRLDPSVVVPPAATAPLSPTVPRIAAPLPSPPPSPAPTPTTPPPSAIARPTPPTLKTPPAAPPAESQALTVSPRAAPPTRHFRPRLSQPSPPAPTPRPTPSEERLNAHRA